jgi:hypothetical protein
MKGWKMWEHGVPDSRLIVVEQAEDYIQPDGTHEAMWICNCLCGTNNVLVRQRHLKHGKIKSCGCYKNELTIQRNKEWHCNVYDLSGEYGIGWTSNTNEKFYFDLKYYEQIKDICWYEVKGRTPNGTNYLKGFDPKTQKCISFHIFIGYRGYDHIDRNELNNLEINLRECTIQENNCNKSLSCRNTSGVTGVSWNKNSQKWCATLKYKGVYKLRQYFDNKDDAIKARLFAEAKYFGEFAPQQHLYEKYSIVENI